MSEFYVYIHRKATTGEVFYVGKGKGKRAGQTADRNTHWQNVANKHGVEVVYAETGMTEDDAFALEMQLIAEYGRADMGEGNLVNWSDGGEGPSGVIVGDETRAKMAEAAKARGVPLERSIAALKLARAAAQTPEAKAKRAAHHIGAKRSDITRERIGAAQKRHRARLKREFLQNFHTVKLGPIGKEILKQRNQEAGYAKTGAKLKGRKFSEETKAKMSAAGKLRTGSKNPAARAVRRVDKPEEVFPTMTAAAKSIGLKSGPKLGQRMREGKAYGGYYWELVDI